MKQKTIKKPDLHELAIKVKDLATELTGHNVLEKGPTTEKAIMREHEANNIAIRKLLINRGVKPEKLKKKSTMNR